MQFTNQDREREKSTAEAQGILSLSLFAAAIRTHNASGGWFWVQVVIAFLFLLSAINLCLVYGWKRKEYLQWASAAQIRHIVWFLGFTGLGLAIMQAGWGFWWGMLCILIAFAILFLGVAGNLGDVGVGAKLIFLVIWIAVIIFISVPDLFNKVQIWAILASAIGLLVIKKMLSW
ncbi:MAG: hypothetical protein Q8O05_05695 [Chloroflexota bacterium]|nr:hypothetical protein [Chloroflexota bacterium]